MWGNQNNMAYYFATHADGAGDMTWQSSTALAIPEGADDHINLKGAKRRPGRARLRRRKDISQQPRRPARNVARAQARRHLDEPHGYHGGRKQNPGHRHNRSAEPATVCVRGGALLQWRHSLLQADQPRRDLFPDRDWARPSCRAPQTLASTTSARPNKTSQVQQIWSSSPAPTAPHFYFHNKIDLP